MSDLKAVLGGALLAVAMTGCTAPPSATDLYTDGPPMVRQVLMTEEFTDTAQNPPIISSRPLQLAFGHHDDPWFAKDDGKVVAAVTKPSGQEIRVVMSHLLVGNYLEEIQCRANVDPNAKPIAAAYSRVPVGDTPDDIARCSGPQDLVFAECTGSKAVCINNTNQTQFTDAQEGGLPVMPGQAAGIHDVDGDGAADSTLFIEGSVRVMCTTKAGRTVEAPLDVAKSYWQPSGNQQVPAHGGVAALGPALVLDTSIGLPTSAQCTLVFDPTVVDDKGLSVCAPPDGDVHQSCPGGNDTSLVSFGTAALRFDAAQPGNTPGVDVRSLITVTFTASMDLTSLQNNVTITEDGQPFAFTVSPVGGSAPLSYNLVTVGAPTSTGAATHLNGNKTYVVTIGPGVTDYAGTPLGGNPVVATTFSTSPTP